MPDEAENERLRARKAREAQREAELAEQTDDADERQAHERRSDKAEYLREKLEDQAQSPDE
jgi:DNA-binding TFAR19-related protein (PDSD5 family)